MRQHAELTDEELGFACGSKLTLANLFVGIMAGYLAWIPLSLVYAALQLGFPGLPERGAGMALTMGISFGGAAIWAVIAAERYRDISFRFNREYLKVYRDGVLRTQIGWEDVESVKPGVSYTVLTRQGSRVEIPFGALLSERHDNRALKNQLSKYRKPQATPSPKKLAAIGFVTLFLGVPMLIGSKRPQEILAQADGLSPSVWIQIVPSVLGVIMTVTGGLCLMISLALVSDRKKPHPFEISDEGIREGKKLLRWSEIRRLSCFGKEELQIQIRLQKGPQRLIDCEKYLNGADLRDAILSMVPSELTQAAPAQRILPGQTLTANSWTTMKDSLGCIGAMAGLSLVLVLAAAMGWMHVARPSDAVSFEVLGSIMFLLLFAVMILACYRVDLSESEIRYKRILLPERRLMLDAIESVEIRSNRTKNGPIDLMTIRGKSASITISSNLERYAEIRDAILSRVPEGKVRYS